MSSFAVDLREQSSIPWPHEQDMLEVNGQTLSASDAIKLVNAFPSEHHFIQHLIDACLVRQAMDGCDFPSTSYAAFRAVVVDARFDEWWASNREGFQTVTCAWMSLTPSTEVPLRILVGNLASNPTAAIVSARCEGRRGAFIESELKDLGKEFAPLRDSSIGAVVPLHVAGPAIGIVIDRADPILDDAARSVAVETIFENWMKEQRAAAQVRWLWRTDEATSAGVVVGSA